LITLENQSTEATLNEKENSTMQISEHKNMTTRIKTLIHKSSLNILRLALLGSLAMAVPLLAQGGTTMDSSDQMHMHDGHSQAPAKLVQIVRKATEEFIDVNNATTAGYEPVLGCVTGPDQGAMGVHYLKGSLLNGEVEATQPQALIYEPLGGSSMRLVGVEYIVDYAAWWGNKKNAGPPALYGQLFQLITSPNRYGLNTFYELHVWAWQDNPNGAFVDWNTRVTCDRQGQFQNQ
jgi:hypothetical protein